MLSTEQILEILRPFGLTFSQLTKFIDSSHGDDDIRWNFLLDERYVLKINSARSMWEARLQEISRLIDRYNAIGVYAPRLLPAKDGRLSCDYEVKGTACVCFVEEYAAYPVCGEETELDWNEITEHLGLLAAKYTNVDLSEIHSMWTIIDLAPLDTDVDEKQENADLLVKTLEENGFADLARQLRAYNEQLRAVIARDFRDLPRCVYQGDLNSANVLHDHGAFAGLIDFNMAGTDVNINVFVNETNAFPEERDFDNLTVPELLTGMEKDQKQKMEPILRHYSLNELEKRLMPYYSQIADLFQWPNVCAMRKWLREENRRDKCAALIRAIMDRPL